MKCIINGRIVLKDKIVDNAVIIFWWKDRKILAENEINIKDHEIIDAKGNLEWDFI